MTRAASSLFPIVLECLIDIGWNENGMIGSTLYREKGFFLSMPLVKSFFVSLGFWLSLYGFRCEEKKIFCSIYVLHDRISMVYLFSNVWMWSMLWQCHSFVSNVSGAPTNRKYIILNEVFGWVHSMLHMLYNIVLNNTDKLCVSSKLLWRLNDFHSIHIEFDEQFCPITFSLFIFTDYFILFCMIQNIFVFTCIGSSQTNVCCILTLFSGCLTWVVWF